MDNVLNSFLEQFECEAKLGTDFCCFVCKNEIRYTLVIPEENSKTFIARVTRLYPDIKADEFLWSFFHELGHIETIDDLTNAEYTFSQEAKGKNPTDEEYYELPDEFAATDWAAHYMRSNTEQIQILWAEIKNAIMNIYKLNKIGE